MPIPAPLLADNETLVWLVVASIVVFGLILFAVFARYFSLWIQCKMTRAGIRWST